jgi:hypothetical protein
MMAFRKSLVFVLVVFMVGLLASVASAQGGPVTVTLAAQSNSGQTGTATLTAVGNQTQVVLNLSPGPAGAGVAQPAHVHEGTCANVGAVEYTLSNVVDGRSTTMVNALISDVATGTHVINVHRSAAEASVYTACGNIQQVAATAGAPTALPSTGFDYSYLWIVSAFGFVLTLGGLVLRRIRA